MSGDRLPCRADGGSLEYGRPRGVYLSVDQPDQIEIAFRNYGLGSEDVDLIVATDAEGILGIGEWGWGVGGIAIALGKLTLYVAAAGLDFGRGSSHFPSGEVIASGLSEGPPGQVKRLGHVVGDDRGHDHQPDIIATAAELPVDPRGKDNIACLLGEPVFEGAADGSPGAPAAAARHGQAHQVTRATTPPGHVNRPVGDATCLAMWSGAAVSHSASGNGRGRWGDGLSSARGAAQA